MLNIRKLGLAGGIVWGGTLFFMTIASMYTGYGDAWVKSWQSVYPALNLSWSGSFAGLIMGFGCGFICSSIFAWVYNKS